MSTVDTAVGIDSSNEGHIPVGPSKARPHHYRTEDEASIQLSSLFEPAIDRDAVSAFPEGGWAGWLVVFGSFCILLATYGLTAAVGLFQAYWQANQLSNFSASDIGWISSVNIFLNLFLGIQIGPLFDRYGPRWLLLGGSIVYVASLAATAECSQFWQFMLAYRVVAGASSALLTTCAFGVIAHWFDKKRGLTTGASIGGSSLGGIVFPSFSPRRLNILVGRGRYAW